MSSTPSANGIAARPDGVAARPDGVAARAGGVAARPRGAVSIGRYRLHILARMLLAIAGGYALAAVAAAAISVGAPAAGLMPRADAVMFGTMFAFVVHAVAAIWVFSCHSPWKALAGIVVPLAVIGVALAATLPGAST